MNKIELLKQGTDVLDHGHVKLIDFMGSDEQIIRAARQSTQKGFLGWGPNYKCNGCGTLHEDAGRPSIQAGGRLAVCHCGSRDITALPGDEKLLKYLYDNWHDTPFEMADVIFEVKAPIFVFREWHRHRTQSYNEVSARYAPLPNENYIPTVERLMLGTTSFCPQHTAMKRVGDTLRAVGEFACGCKVNKQAGVIHGAEDLTEESAEAFRQYLRTSYEESQETYEWALSRGVPKELARVHLPVGRYSQMWAKANLRNWLAFMTLRSEKNPKAQWEIRCYANVVADMLKVLYPKTMKLFNSGRKR